MLETVLGAILKELMLRYPELAWYSIVAQIEHLGEDALDALKEWWATEMPDKPWPEMEPQENPGQPYDPGQV